jgi:hypothetical protein
VIADTTRSTDVTGTLRGQLVSGARAMADVIERFSITHGVNLLLMNVVARRELGSHDPSGAASACKARQASSCVSHDASTSRASTS